MSDPSAAARQVSSPVSLGSEVLSAEASKWIDRAASLGPVLEKYRDETERDRRLAQPVVEALQDGGFFRLWVPAAFGGEQLDAETSLRALEELARWDGAAAWNATLTSGLGPMAEYLPRSSAEAVWGTPDGPTRIVAGSVFPAGRAVRTSDGYIVSGRFPFSSNGQNADWLIAACIVMDGDGPVVSPEGVPEIRMLFLPASEVTWEDTWRTLGLRGTGSHHFNVGSVFVPADLSFQMAALATGPAGDPATLAYPYPYYTFAAGAATAVSLGLARGAIDSFCTLALSKTPTAGATALAAQHSVQERVGRAEAMTAAAKAYLFSTMRRVEAAGPGPQADVAASVRLACAYVAEQCAEVVKMMYTAGGGTALYESSALERQFRDVHMITQHVAVAPFHFEMVGQYLLGGELAMRR